MRTHLHQEAALLARSRSTRRAALAIAAICLVLSPQAALAQRPRARAGQLAAQLAAPVPMIGIRSGYDFEGEAWSRGGQARLPVARRLELIPSGDAFFDSERTDWQLNADVALRLGRRGGLYVGAGLAAASRTADADGDSNAQLGTNLFAGFQARGRLLPVRPFAEARWTLVDGDSPFRLAFGANLPLRAVLGR